MSAFAVPATEESNASEFAESWPLLKLRAVPKEEISSGCSPVLRDADDGRVDGHETPRRSPAAGGTWRGGWGAHRSWREFLGVE